MKSEQNWEILVATGSGNNNIGHIQVPAHAPRHSWRIWLGIDWPENCPMLTFMESPQKRVCPFDFALACERGLSHIEPAFSPVYNGDEL